jgi:predicted house-cleaning noncanonical NTP pyrophosphatase (MazG superfamily)
MEKLVRDKIIEFSEKEQDGRKFRTASPVEIPQFLSNKILEEANEVMTELLDLSSFSKVKVTEELADVLEVVGAICEHYGIKPSDVEEAKAKKLEKKGGFKNNLILDLTSNIKVKKKDA